MAGVCRGDGPCDTSSNDHGGKNWVSKAGGFPDWFHAIVNAMRRKGKTEGEAVAIAWGTVRRWARGGGNVTPETRAKAAAMVARLDAMRGAANLSAERWQDAIDLAAAGGHHVAGTAYHWSHNWHPLDVRTAMLNNKRVTAADLHRKGAPHFNPEPAKAGYVTGVKGLPIRVHEAPKTPDVTSMARITIEHTGDGTLVHGTDRTDAPQLKAAGFKWSRNLNAWFLPRTWSYGTRDERVRRLQASLGSDVHVESTPEVHTTAAEREAAQVERGAARAERMDARAAKESAAASSRFAAADQISSMIPMGQPILVGHHSEGRHRRDISRIGSNMDKGVAHSQAAKDAERSAAAARAEIASRQNPVAIGRRLERLRTEHRDVQRMLDGSSQKMGFKPAIGEHRDRLTARSAALQDEIQHAESRLASLQVAGAATGHSQQTIKSGDYVKVRGQWRKVVKANAKSVSVETGYSWTDKAPYHEITDHRSAVNLSVPVETGSELTVPKMAPMSTGQHMAALRKLAAAHKRAGPSQRPKLRKAMAAHAKSIQGARKTANLAADSTPTVDLTWDESLHPRQSGKFAPKGTQTQSAKPKMGTPLPAATAAQIRDFQKRMGLPITGTFDPATKAAMAATAAAKGGGGGGKGGGGAKKGKGGATAAKKAAAAQKKNQANVKAYLRAQHAASVKAAAQKKKAATPPTAAAAMRAAAAKSPALQAYMKAVAGAKKQQAAASKARTARRAAVTASNVKATAAFAAKLAHH